MMTSAQRDDTCEDEGRADDGGLMGNVRAPAEQTACMYQQKQLEEIKRKQECVLSSPLLSHMHVLYSHSMQQCVGVFSHCVLRNS